VKEYTESLVHEIEVEEELMEEKAKAPGQKDPKVVKKCEDQKRQYTAMARAQGEKADSLRDLQAEKDKAVEPGKQRR